MLHNTKKVLGLLFFRFFLFFKRNYIFCYHEITNKPSEFQKNYGLFVGNTIFCSQINWMEKYFKFINPNKIKSDNKNTAIITFDDGYEGSFLNTLNFLRKKKIYPIFFLNIKNIKYSKIPLINSLCCYLEKKKIKPIKNFYLKANKNDLRNFYKNKSIIKKVIYYQGNLIKFNTLKKLLKNNKNIILSNHLHEHYNAKSIDEKFFKKLFHINKKELLKLNQKNNFFAFPNGVQNIGYNKKNVSIVKKINQKKNYIFTIDGKNNLLSKSNQVLHRIVIDNNDCDSMLKYKIIRSFF